MLTNSLGMRFAPIPAGSFLMGSPPLEHEECRRLAGHAVLQYMPDLFLDEVPRRGVTISRPFHLGVTQVTQEQYLWVMGRNPSDHCASGSCADRVAGRDTGDFPVESVSYYDAVDFCERLSALPAERAAGRRYRLPMEAEWEYSCRAGTTTAFHFGDRIGPDVANVWYDGRPPPAVACPVGSYAPNAWGLYDTHGNVWEWTADWYGEGYYATGPAVDPAGPAGGVKRVIRGGCFGSEGCHCRSACRDGLAPDRATGSLGFRVAMVQHDAVESIIAYQDSIQSPAGG